MKTDLATTAPCTITETGLEFGNNVSEADWRDMGQQLARLQRAQMWWVGDWLLAGEEQGYLPRGKLGEACEAFGIAYDTAKQAVRVCKTYERCSRLHLLTFTHHQEVANRPDADKLLEWAVNNKATVKQLRTEKKRLVNLEAPRAATAQGKNGQASWSFQVGDCADLPFDDDTFDLVFCSPPYESQRSYGDSSGDLEFSMSGEEWVSWAVKCYGECLRVCRGLVAWVVEGFTSDFAYSSTPFLLLADLHRAGVKVRKPCVYQRNGIPGTGGPEWLRNDWEPIICATKNGRLPWSDQTAMGKPPKQNKPRTATNRNKDGTRKNATYNDPEICNPGNIISGLVGCGGLGWKGAHKNEAPFPEWLAEFFIRSFCPPGGHVLDPFSGSGTTVGVAVRHERNAIGIDIRQTQIALGKERLLGLQRLLI